MGTQSHRPNGLRWSPMAAGPPDQRPLPACPALVPCRSPTRTREERAMDQQHQDPNQIAFLQGAWRALLQDQPEPFPKNLLEDFLSSDVLRSLPSHTTLKNVLHECHSREAFQASYIKSFLGLRRVWDKLTPESRHITIQYGNRCGMQ